MPAGLDELSAISGLISLSITLLRGCVKGFELLCRAKRCENHISTLQLMLEFQKLRLLEWARVAGLLTTPPTPAFNVVHLPLVEKTLDLLSALLNDTRELRQYGMNIERTAEIVTEISHDTELTSLESAEKAEIQESIVATTAIFQQRTSPWQRLRWIAVDERRFQELLDNISRMIDQLCGLLTSDQVRELNNQYDTILRNAVINTNDPRALEMLGNSMLAIQKECSIAATAQLKKRSLRFGFRNLLQRGSSGEKAGGCPASSDGVASIPMRQLQFDREDDTTPRSFSISAKELRRLDLSEIRGCREMAFHGSLPVVIEWRRVDESSWQQLKGRLDKLTNLLSSMDDASFHTLPCYGYLTRNKHNRYGIVFKLPAEVLSPRSSPSLSKAQAFGSPDVRTLHDLMSSEPTPSLNARVKCAITIFETTLQLHTADWLHKELRSENLFFLHDKRQAGDQDSLIASNMYVGGYGYARADDPLEFTEPARSKIEIELYRHPASLGSTRQQYRKSFDIFSIGCIMLELGFWEPFANILSRKARAGKLSSQTLADIVDLQETTPPPHFPGSHGDSSILSRSTNLDLLLLREEFIKETDVSPGKRRQIFEALEARTGKAYAQVVLECLTMDSLQRSRTSSTGDNQQISALKLEQRSLQQLRKLEDVL